MSAARRRGVTKSAIVRAAIQSYLSTDGNVGRTSFGALAKDFAGCLEGGPPDLSYNKRRLKRFGK